jgi:hypothetical protein
VPDLATAGPASLRREGDAAAGRRRQGKELRGLATSISAGLERSGCRSLPPLLLRFRTDLEELHETTGAGSAWPPPHLRAAGRLRHQGPRQPQLTHGGRGGGAREEARGDVGGGGEEAVEMGEVTVFPENEQRERCKRKTKMPLQHSLDSLQ